MRVIADSGRASRRAVRDQEFAHAAHRGLAQRHALPRREHLDVRRLRQVGGDLARDARRRRRASAAWEWGISRTNSRVTLKMKSPPNMRLRKAGSSAGSMSGQRAHFVGPLRELAIERRAIGRPTGRSDSAAPSPTPARAAPARARARTTRRCTRPSRGSASRRVIEQREVIVGVASPVVVRPDASRATARRCARRGRSS